MNNNKSLYAVWLEAHKNGDLPAEWRQAHNFLTWATANGYKTEYGYKGEFTPDNLKLAIKDAHRKIDRKKIAEEFNLPEKLLDGHDDEFAEFAKMTVPQERVDKLVNNNTLAALKDMARGIDLGKATKKEDIARMIIARSAFAEPEVNADASE